MYKNYHTHTYRCKHAKGSIEDYANSAIENKVPVLGFSEHTPLPDNRWLDVRMEFRELSAYVADIENAQQKFSELIILKGMECEYTKEYHNYYKDELLGRYKLDYLISAPHYYLYEGAWHFVYAHAMDKYHLKAYTECLIKSMECGLFDFVAHPDLFGGSYELWDEHTITYSRLILEAAQRLKMPLEINGYGLRKPKKLTSQGERLMYPLEKFWELAAEYDITVVVNSDAHKPEDIIGKMDEGLSIVKKYNLKLADLSYLEK